jgi:hypothetical protein
MAIMQATTVGEDINVLSSDRVKSLNCEATHQQLATWEESQLMRL